VSIHDTDPTNPAFTTGDVTLQINLAPPDISYITETLPHQLRTWAPQVGPIILTLDLRRPAGRQFGTRWDESIPRIRAFLGGLAEEWPQLGVSEVDYSRSARRAVADAFFGGAAVPLKDFRGGPYYSYFFGLSSVGTRFMLHLDADMMFGGRSATWTAEAAGTLSELAQVVFVNPFPGPPPPPGGRFVAQSQEATRIDDASYLFPHVSTRLFFADLPALQSRVCPLSPDRQPGTRVALASLRRGQTNRALPEAVMSETMRQHGLRRLDLLGATPGMWAVHPVTRTPEYYAHLPELIARVEAGDVSPEQVGDYNLHDSMLRSDSSDVTY
jgi:hypothetical protein